LANKHNTADKRNSADKHTTPRKLRIWLLAFVICSIAIAVYGGIVLFLAFVIGIAMWRFRRKMLRKRLKDNAVIYDLAEVIDLFLLGASAGLTIWLTLEEVSQLVANSLSETFEEAVKKVKQGASLLNTLEWLSIQHDGQLRLLTRPLIEAERYGVELTPSLTTAVIEARRQHRRNGEIAARSVAVKLMFPLVLCILPAFALLTVVPQLANTLDLLQSSQT